MGAIEHRLRQLEERRLPGYCLHQPVRVEVDGEPPLPPPPHCWCRQDPLVMRVEYVAGVRPPWGGG